MTAEVGDGEGNAEVESDLDPGERCRLTFDEDVELVDQSEQDPDGEREREGAAEVRGLRADHGGRA